MVTIVLLIGVLNFGIGFALAVYLRHSPNVELFMPRFGPLGLHVPLPRISLRKWCARREASEIVASATDATNTIAAFDEQLDGPLEASTQSQEDSPPVSKPDGRSLDELLAATAALVDSVAAEFGPSHPARGARRVPKVLDELMADAKRYRGELLSLEDQLRVRLTNTDEQPLDVLLAHYQRVNSEWSRRLFADATCLQAAQDQQTDERSTVRAVEDFLYDQAARIAEVCTHCEPLGLAEVRAECRRLLRDVCTLTELAHALRDQLLDGKRQLNGGVGVATAATIDELTGLRNLIGLEAWLTKWCGTVDASSAVVPPAVAAIVDIDRFRLVNERIGHRGCDQMLTALARLFEDLFPHDEVPSIMASIGGAKFVFVWESRSVADATASVERIRQSLEAATFDCGEMECTATLSGAVCSVAAETSTTALLRRLQTALVTAKRAGRNRTCAEAKTGLQIVTPMRMEIAGQTLTLPLGVAI